MEKGLVKMMNTKTDITLAARSMVLQTHERSNDLEAENARLSTENMRLIAEVQSFKLRNEALWEMYVAAKGGA
jgi:hypothetical protein